MGRKEKIILVVIFLFASTLISGLIGYSIGTGEYDEMAHATGYEAGYEKAKNDLQPGIDSWQKTATDIGKERDDTIVKYNELVDRYNQLARTPVYKPLNCTSTTYGSYFPTTYTNCY